MFIDLISRFVGTQNTAQNTVFHATWRDPNNSIPLKADTAQAVPSKSEADSPLQPESRINPAWVRLQRERIKPNFATVKAEEAEKTDYLAVYNSWLKDYLLQGNRITHFYDYPCPSIEVVTDPRNQRPLSTYGMCGANSRNYILSREFTANHYVSDFTGDRCHNNMYGWTNGGKTAVAYDGHWVPAYTNTIDKEMMHDESVPESVRLHIRHGVAEEAKQARAWSLDFHPIMGEYAKSEESTHAPKRGYYRNSRDNEAERVGRAINWYANSKDNSAAPTLSQPTMPSEVIVKDDLPATDTEARVERRYEYLLDPAGIAAGHKECIFPGSAVDITLYNLCGRNDTVKFVRSETVIHIPQGSGEKMLPVVAE
jgi:hypothetical protein